MEYPKIETLWNRDERTHRVDPALGLRMTEFLNIKVWHITEKIDGMNVRVILTPDRQIAYRGRTDAAQMPPALLAYLERALPAHLVAPVFDTAAPVILFGEGYGGKIQHGGNYRPNPAFRLFDVRVGQWWLEPDALLDIAGKLGIATVPQLGMIDYLPTKFTELQDAMCGGLSRVSEAEGDKACRAEGIVARTTPLLLTRRGERVMWKLKFKDF